MSKNKKLSIKIEEAVGILSGETLTNAHNLISFLHDNKMNPINTSKNGWKIISKACVVCYIWLEPNNTLTICPFISEYESTSLSEEFKEIVWSKKTPWSSCGTCQAIDGGHCSYKVKTVFGRRYDNACARSIVFKDPNSNEIECLKKLLEMRKNTIKTGKRLPTLPTNYI